VDGGRPGGRRLRDGLLKPDRASYFGELGAGTADVRTGSVQEGAAAPQASVL
jgi:hypothetical protein